MPIIIPLIIPSNNIPTLTIPPPLEFRAPTLTFSNPLALSAFPPSYIPSQRTFTVMNQKPNQYFAKASTVEAKRLKLQEEPRLRESFKRGKEKFENANRAT